MKSGERNGLEACFVRDQKGNTLKTFKNYTIQERPLTDFPAGQKLIRKFEASQ